MLVLFDTSVFIAALVEEHPKHDLALPWLANAQHKKFELITTNHILAECFAVLTRLPISRKISSTNAKFLIEENITNTANIINLTSKDYLAAIEHVTKLGLPGGIIYDALIFQAAKKAKANKIITFNHKHFAQLAIKEKDAFVATP